MSDNIVVTVCVICVISLVDVDIQVLVLVRTQGITEKLYSHL
jgi:hypothetical protein